MADPSLIIDSAGVLQKVMKIGLEIYNAPKESESMKMLHDQVERDLKYATNFRNEIKEVLGENMDQHNWIVSVMNHTRDTLEKFHSLLLQAPVGKNKPGTSDKAEFVISNAKEAIKLEKILVLSHASLLTGVSLMHQIAIQSGELKTTRSIPKKRRNMGELYTLPARPSSAARMLAYHGDDEQPTL